MFRLTSKHPKLYWHVTKADNISSILNKGLVFDKKFRNYKGKDKSLMSKIYLAENINYAYRCWFSGDKSNWSSQPAFILCQIDVDQPSVSVDEDLVLWFAKQNHKLKDYDTLFKNISGLGISIDKNNKTLQEFFELSKEIPFSKLRKHPIIVEMQELTREAMKQDTSRGLSNSSIASEGIDFDTNKPSHILGIFTDDKQYYGEKKWFNLFKQKWGEKMKASYCPHCGNKLSSLLPSHKNRVKKNKRKLTIELSPEEIRRMRGMLDEFEKLLKGL